MIAVSLADGVTLGVRERKSRANPLRQRLRIARGDQPAGNLFRWYARFGADRFRGGADVSCDDWAAHRLGFGSRTAERFWFGRCNDGNMGCQVGRWHILDVTDEADALGEPVGCDLLLQIANVFQPA